VVEGLRRSVDHVGQRAVERARLERVQRWVMSSLAATTILHLSAGLSIAAWFMAADRAVPRYCLVLTAGILGVL